MANLSPEIWILVFEEIYQIEPYDPYSFVPPLQRLRLVSRWFNLVVTPYLYRQRYLRARDLAKPNDPRSARELSNIRDFTKELVMADYHQMNDDLLGPAADQISACRVLECLKWHTTSPAPPRRTGLVPTLILGAFLSKSIRNARVEMSQNWFTVSPHMEPGTLGFIARSEEASYSLHEPSTPGSSASLDLLDIETRSYLPCLSLFNTRLPPMKMLVLRSYPWLYNESQVSILWDFSLLQYLRLDDVPMVHFLTSIPASQFCNLRCLGFKPTLFTAGGNEQIKPLLAQLFLATTVLEELEISGCWRDVLTIGSLSRLPNLRVLRLRNLHHEQSDDDLASCGMRGSEIKDIQTWCRGLIGVEFDMEFTGDRPLHSLTLFTTFPSLRRLYINAFHGLPPRHPPPPNTQPRPIPTTIFNPDPLNIAQMLTHVQSSKIGVRFTRIDISLDICREEPSVIGVTAPHDNAAMTEGFAPASPDSGPESDAEERKSRREERFQREFNFTDRKGEQILWRGDKELR